MADEQSKPKKLSMASTKKEMLEAYGALLKQLQEKKESELKPAERLEEKKTREVVEITKSLSTDGVVKGINNLKVEIGTVLAEISDKMEREVQKFEAIQKAIDAKEKEFQELYDIEKSAATFAALIEAQRQKREEFESEMDRKREELDREIQTAREQWRKEKSEHEALIKERDAEEKKKRARDEEEFSYAFKREQRLAKDKFGDEKIQLEREMQLKKETMEKELAEREKIVAERERQLNELQGKVAGFPKELDVAVNQAAKEASDRVKAEAKNREELLKREFEGEGNVLTARIESLEKTAQQQTDQITKLSHQLEMAYQKVQDIALKAVEGSSNIRSLASLQQFINEQAKKPSQDK